MNSKQALEMYCTCSKFFNRPPPKINNTYVNLTLLHMTSFCRLLAHAETWCSFGQSVDASSYETV